MSVDFLAPGDFAFPNSSPALAECGVPVAVSADLAAERLLAAYRLGIFPWFSEGGLF